MSNKSWNYRLKTTWWRLDFWSKPSTSTPSLQGLCLLCLCVLCVVLQWNDVTDDESEWGFLLMTHNLIFHSCLLTFATLTHTYTRLSLWPWSLLHFWSVDSFFCPADDVLDKHMSDLLMTNSCDWGYTYTPPNGNTSVPLLPISVMVVGEDDEQTSRRSTESKTLYTDDTAGSAYFLIRKPHHLLLFDLCGPILISFY